LRKAVSVMRRDPAVIPISFVDSVFVFAQAAVNASPRQEAQVVATTSLKTIVRSEDNATSARNILQL